AHDAGGELLGGLPSVGVEPMGRGTVGQKGKLTRLMDHAADRVGVGAAANALKDHLGNGFLAVLAFAASLVIEGLRHAGYLGHLGLLGANLVPVRRKRR